MTSVWVVNGSDDSLEDGWAGVRYAFKPGVPVEVPLEAARTIFGYQAENKVANLARLGWCKLATEVPQALERLEKFRILDERPEEKPAKVVKLAK